MHNSVNFLIRLFLKDPDILILDEATSALDLISLERFNTDIEVVKENKIIFRIPHNEKLISISDYIINNKDLSSNRIKLKRREANFMRVRNIVSEEINKFALIGKTDKWDSSSRLIQSIEEGEIKLDRCFVIEDDNPFLGRIVYGFFDEEPYDFKIWEMKIPNTHYT